MPSPGNIDNALNCTTTLDCKDNCPSTSIAVTPGTSAALTALTISNIDPLPGLYAAPVSPSTPVPVATNIVPIMLEVAPINVKLVLPMYFIT